MSIPPPGVDLHKPQEPVAPRASRVAARGARAWQPWMGIVALLVGFGVTIFAGGIVAGISAAAGESIDELPPDLTIALTIFQNLSLLGAAFGFAWLAGGRPSAEDFGLRAAPLVRAIGLMIVVWLAFFLFAAAWTALLGIQEQEQDLPEQLGIDRSTLAALVVVFMVTVIAPLGEELFFRGFFFGSLRNWRGPWPAAAITGLVFGAVHAGSSPWGFIVPLALFGSGLCILYHYSGSLYPCIALHALNNSVALGAGMKWDWQIPAMMVASVVVSLTIAWLIARALGPRRDLVEMSAAAPSPA